MIDPTGCGLKMKSVNVKQDTLNSSDLFRTAFGALNPDSVEQDRSHSLRPAQFRTLFLEIT